MADILYNVKLVVLTELDPLTGLVKGGAVPINLTCDSDVELDPVVSKGEEKVLRDDVKILAVARTEDLLYGYNLKMKNSTFDVDAASLIEGGTIRKSGENIVGYDSPMLSQGVTMKPFRAEVYVANYAGDSILNYTKITLTKCTGKAPKLVFKKDFFAPEFEIEARENTLAVLPVKKIDYVSSLPATDSTAPTLTMVSTGSIARPAVVTAKSSELGVLYLALSAAVPTSVTQLNMLVSMNMASCASVAVINTNTDIATTALSAGTYKCYAVDYAGNISAAGATITLT